MASFVIPKGALKVGSKFTFDFQLSHAIDSTPVAPALGDFFYEIDTDMMWTYDGVCWVES